MTLTASQPVSTSTDEEQIRAVVAERSAAIRAKDAERVVAQFAPEIALFSLAPPLAQPNAEVLDPSHKQAWFAGFEAEMSSEVRNLVVVAGDDVAVCHGLASLSATPRGAAEGFTMWYRLTLGLRKVDDRWLIIHEHDSTPFYMDGSFRAAVDLQD